MRNNFEFGNESHVNIFTFLMHAVRREMRKEKDSRLRLDADVGARSTQLKEICYASSSTLTSMLGVITIYELRARH